jgi:hypothetical protein
MGAEERGRHDGDTLQGFKSIYRLRNVPTRLPLVYPPQWFGLPAMFKRGSTASGVVTTFGFPAICRGAKSPQSRDHQSRGHQRRGHRGLISLLTLYVREQRDPTQRNQAFPEDKAPDHGRETR